MNDLLTGIGTECMLATWNKETCSKPNNGPNARKIKKRLEELGHTDVYVWFENLGPMMMMGGMGGGYFYVSDQSGIEPIGYTFSEALECIEEPWHKAEVKA